MKERIKSLNGLKVIACLFIVWHHIGNHTVYNLNFDAGARMCEFFFVVSGFLVGYNAYNKVLIGEYEQLNHKKTFVKKFLALWPLHLICLLIHIIISICSGTTLKVAHIPALIANIFLLQAWSTDANVFFSYNGLSWFLSALLFCYFIAPMFVKKLKSIKKSSFYLALFIFLRITLEIFSSYLNFQFFPFVVHTSPIIRFLEFGIGLFSIPIFVELKKKIADNTIQYNTIQYNTIQYNTIQ